MNNFPRFYWFVDGSPSGASVPDIARIVDSLDVDHDKHPYYVVKDFPASLSYIDSSVSGSWKDASGQEHSGCPVGRALPFDNGVGVRWQAIVYTNSDMLVSPPKKATGPGSSPDLFGNFYSAENCKAKVEQIAQLPKGDDEWGTGEMG